MTSLYVYSLTLLATRHTRSIYYTLLTWSFGYSVLWLFHWSIIWFGYQWTHSTYYNSLVHFYTTSKTWGNSFHILTRIARCALYKLYIYSLTLLAARYIHSLYDTLARIYIIFTHFTYIYSHCSLRVIFTHCTTHWLAFT